MSWFVDYPASKYARGYHLVKVTFEWLSFSPSDDEWGDYDGV